MEFSEVYSYDCLQFRGQQKNQTWLLAGQCCGGINEDILQPVFPPFLALRFPHSPYCSHNSSPYLKEKSQNLQDV